jgi:hypothetical protein
MAAPIKQTKPDHTRPASAAQHYAVIEVARTQSHLEEHHALAA